MPNSFKMKNNERVRGKGRMGVTSLDIFHNEHLAEAAQASVFFSLPTCLCQPDYQVMKICSKRIWGTCALQQSSTSLNFFINSHTIQWGLYPQDTTLTVKQISWGDVHAYPQYKKWRGRHSPCFTVKQVIYIWQSFEAGRKSCIVHGHMVKERQIIIFCMESLQTLVLIDAEFVSQQGQNNTEAELDGWMC